MSNSDPHPDPPLKSDADPHSTTLSEAHAHVTTSALWTSPLFSSRHPRRQMLEEQLPPAHGEKKDSEKENVVIVTDATLTLNPDYK